MQIIIADGRFYTRATGASVFVEHTLPLGVLLRDPRPCASRNRRISVINGRFNPGLVYRDDLDLLNKLGLTAPPAPTIADGGAGALTGVMIGYIAAVHKVDSGGPDEQTLHESSLSDPSSSLNITNRRVTWTIPATAADARTTHFRLYRSTDGALPKFVADVAIGTTTYDDNVDNTTGFTPLVTADGDLDPDGRDPPPYCLFNAVFHERTWYFGDPEHPERAWFSALNEPESVGPLSYRDTTDLRAITGGGRSGEQLVLFGISTMYAIAGYTQADFIVVQVSASVGCVSHFSIVYVSGLGLLFISLDGAQLYDGQIRFMMRKLRSNFRDAYAADPTNFKNCIAADDRYWHTYKLLIPSQTGPVLYFVGHYLPIDTALEGGEAQPWWLLDRRDRPDWTLAAVNGDGDEANELWTGSCDGFVRRENQEDDADDDGDTYQKTAVVRTKHHFLRGQRGGSFHGMSMKAIALYIRSSLQSYFVSLFGGDDPAREAAQPTWGPYEFPPLSQAGAVDETVKLIRPAAGSGRGQTLELTVPHPVGLEYRGVSFDHTAGPQGRGRK